MFLQRLGGESADKKMMAKMKVFDDCLVEAKTAQTHGAGSTLSVDREHRNLGCSGTAFNDHRSAGFADGQLCSDSRCKWLAHQFDPPETGIVSGGKQRIRFRFRGVRRNTDHRRGASPALLANHRRQPMGKQRGGGFHILQDATSKRAANHMSFGGPIHHRQNVLA